MVSNNALDSLSRQALFAVLDISYICGHIDLVRSCWCHVQQYRVVVFRTRHSVIPLILVLGKQRHSHDLKASFSYIASCRPTWTM